MVAINIMLSIVTIKLSGILRIFLDVGIGVLAPPFCCRTLQLIQSGNIEKTVQNPSRRYVFRNVVLVSCSSMKETAHSLKEVGTTCCHLSNLSRNWVYLVFGRHASLLGQNGNSSHHTVGRK